MKDSTRALVALLVFPLIGILGSSLIRGSTAQVTSALTSGTNASLVEVQFLAPRQMKVVRDARCTSYVDMTTAASRLPASTPEARELRDAELEDSLRKGWDAACYILKAQ